MDKHDDPTPADAAAALARADQLKISVDDRSGWLVRFQLGFAAMSLIMALLLGLLPRPAGIVASLAFMVITLPVLIFYAVRQPVAHRGMARSHLLMMAAWTVLYLATITSGLRFPGEPAFWVPAAVIVSLPGFAGAYLTARRVHRRATTQ